MVIFTADGKITPANDKTNIKHEFSVPDNIKLIKIKFFYTPKTLENREKAAAAIRSCFYKYDEKLTGRPSDYLPVKNLVTISVDENKCYRGAAHRQANDQEHIIGENYASPGFIKGKIQPGEWDIELNIHCACCDINYTITIEGETSL